MKKKIVFFAIPIALLLLGSYLIFTSMHQSDMHKTMHSTKMNSDTEQNNANTGEPIVQISLPLKFSNEATQGKQLFEKNCIACHGKNATGKQGVAPPLIHKIYEPSHHNDGSFQRAVANGVIAHHWPFGNMPAISGLNEQEVSAIIVYIREVQQANSIF